MSVSRSRGELVDDMSSVTVGDKWPPIQVAEPSAPAAPIGSRSGAEAAAGAPAAPRPVTAVVAGCGTALRRLHSARTATRRWRATSPAACRDFPTSVAGSFL
jgi:hypothetical protein